MLLDAGANLMCRDKELSTPLHHAASEGNMDLVMMLFEAGARTKEAWVTLTEVSSLVVFMVDFFLKCISFDIIPGLFISLILEWNFYAKFLF